VSLNWTNVKSLAIPVGGVSRDVKRVSISGVTVWEKPSPLPYDAEVEYLESTGTQYINTGYKPKANSGVQVSFRVAYIGSNDGVFGARTSGANDRFWIVPSSVGLNYGFGSAFSLAAISASTIYTASLNFKEDGKAICGANSTNVSGFNGCPYSLYLFAANVSGTASFMEYGKRVYGCKITEGSEVVHDFIPVRVGTVGYLYDRVSGQLFGNAGTGAFGYGADLPLDSLAN
jgi:hypothetical protein